MIRMIILPGGGLPAPPDPPGPRASGPGGNGPGGRSGPLPGPGNGLRGRSGAVSEGANPGRFQAPETTRTGPRARFPLGRRPGVQGVQGGRRPPRVARELHYHVMVIMYYLGQRSMSQHPH